jgi:hypothetical protein
MNAPTRDDGGRAALGSNYSVTCWPGRRSQSFPHEIRPGQWVLVLHLDPVDTVITQAPFPTGAADFVRWCRELSRAAGQVATQVENTAAGSTAPRHYLDEHNDPGEHTDGGEWQW